MATKTTLSRQDLFDHVWAKPATKVAQELGISMARLVKVCDDNGIPRPPTGYWGGLKWGKEYERPSLSPAESPEKEQVVIEPSMPRHKDEFPAVPVPARLKTPHPVVAAAIAMLERERRDRDGLASSGGRNAVRIAVTPKNINRAVRIMDAFVKEMVKKGFTLQPHGTYENAELELFKGGRHYPLKLREHLQRSELPLTPNQTEDLKKRGHSFGERYKYTPDGKFIFSFGEDFDPVICQDTANTRLEDKLGRFIGRILQEVAEEEEQARRFAEEEAVRGRDLAERRKREAEEARLRKEEEDRVSKMKDTIDRWRLSRDVREYVKEMRYLIASHEAKASKGGPVAKWMEWASNYADRIDPFAPLKEQLLKILAMQQKQE